jgi:hypothetical protein
MEGLSGVAEKRRFTGRGTCSFVMLIRRRWLLKGRDRYIGAKPPPVRRDELYRGRHCATLCRISAYYLTIL